MSTMLDSHVETDKKVAESLEKSIPPLSENHTLKAAKPRLEFLDSLRGLAAFYVLIYHVVLIPEPDLSVPQWAKMIVLNGGMGVTLFFVVSAFSLYYTMPARLAERHPWLSFFVHRFFRIAPLFYFLIIVTLLRDTKIFNLNHSMAEIAFSLSFLFNLVPQGQEGFVWASWTIGIEMIFYALFPLFYLFANNKLRALMLAMLLLLAWYAIKALAVYFTTDPKTLEMFSQWNFMRHLPVFAGGAVAYHLFVDPDRTRAVSPDASLLLVVASLFLYAALLNGWLPNVFGNSYYWQAVLFAMLLLGLARAPLALLVNGMTRYLGKISYSLYLNHPTIIFLLSPVYVHIQKAVPDPSISLLLCIAVTLLPCLIVSELTYRFIEEPGIHWGKRVNRYLQKHL